MNLKLVERVADELRTALADYEPERLTGADADRMLSAFAEVERLAAAGKLLSARRVESSNVWRRRGHRSAAAHLAEATGTGLGPAINTLETARQLGELPATDDALRNGRLSEAQVKEIAGAASVQPDAEQELVDAAGKQPLNVLKLRCRRVKAVGTDQDEAYRRIHRSRYLRHWTDNDGAVRFDARLTPDQGAVLVNAVKGEADRLAAEARRAGQEEPARALAADALVRLAGSGCHGHGHDHGNGNGRTPGAGPDPVTADGRTRGSGVASADGADGESTRDTASDPDRAAGACRCGGAGPTAMVHVRVDNEALVRGHLEPGEVCEIPGIGPIPVEVARRLAADSILSVLVTDGVDVTAVSRSDRTIPAAVRRALIERDQVCVVPGCEVRDALENDHVHEFGRGGPTALDNLARLCHWHHYLKTHQRYRLERVGDGWTWTPPDPPRDPDADAWPSG
jgi:hypothetical protein